MQFYHPGLRAPWSSDSGAGRFLRRALFALVLSVAGLLPAAGSIYAQHLKLDALCAQANRIFRGTVLTVTAGQVSVGGGSLPTATYKIQVKDTMAGTVAETVTLTMVSEPKARPQQGNIQRQPVLELPTLEEGKEYLLFLTKPSKIGLTSPVGLVQGCFTITKKGDTEFAVNGVNNAGLGIGDGGPVKYEELAKRIQALRPN
ncbi:MAG TPA: hypothetical protein PLX89_01235 [Verrucomicrobiota bacterium]|nr:hypothetical protein [Verrucomicrobiales bacterium]HRI11600.1 hypothetical protein [Verrucomicrobiota bacterium]